jgi:hypothetical protein
MISTQTAAELGLPLEAFRGMVFLEIEPTGASGHGLCKAAGFAKLQEKVEEIYGEDWLVNAKIEIIAGTSHVSYGTNRFRLWADQYNIETLRTVLGSDKVGRASSHHNTRVVVKNEEGGVLTVLHVMAKPDAIYVRERNGVTVETD